MQNILYKIFVSSYLPLGILSASICSYEIFRYNEEFTAFFICVILFILSFILENLTNKLMLWHKNSVLEYDIPNPIFPAIELLNDVSKQKSYLLSVINDYSNSLSEKINKIYNNIDITTNIFNQFLSNKSKGNEELSDKIKVCNKIFEKLGNSVELSHKNLNSLNKKLEASCTALVSVENHDKMLKDINSTFTSIFIEQSLDINAKIQRILDSLGNITYKCANIQNFPKPYKDIIDLYSSKIEIVFKILDRQKYKLLFEEHMKTGKSCVYTDPVKAINETSEAIRINPESAEAYYYRGMAYQIKDKPEFSTALKDFERALELKATSNLYGKCIKELREKINKDRKE
jgi:tetratricopeptide (TPR) repeat protein